MAFLDAAEVERLADAIDTRYRVLVLAAAYTGARASELAALRVKRLNLLRGTMEVVESVTEVDGKQVWGATKTYEARTVRLPRFLVEELAAYLADRPHGHDDLVFTSPEGGPLRQTTFMSRVFRPAVEAAGLPDGLRFHDLRHTAASLMIASGASVKAVQRTLGHATAAMTLDRYGHLYPDELESLADRLDQARARAAECSPRVAQEGTMVRIAAGQRHV
jgi:integrase